MIELSWFAVRCVFELDPKLGAGNGSPPEHLYEERITLWQATSIDDAIRKAESEAREYCDDDTTYLGFAQAFGLFDAPVSGAEIFSLMRDSDQQPSEYLAHHFVTGRERQETD